MDKISSCDSSVQMISHKYKHHDYVLPSYSSEKKKVMCSQDKNLSINSTKKYLVQMLTEAAQRVLATDKPVLDQEMTERPHSKEKKTT